jgi:hypothetical protein
MMFPSSHPWADGETLTGQVTGSQADASLRVA